MNNENAFTLVEVLVAIAVLTTGILAMQVMQGMSIEDNTKSGQITVKSMLAAAQIERILTLGYNNDLLQDTDLDGTGQDLDLDGLDDNDDPDVNTTGVDELFGLRHSQCCDDGAGNLVDPRGNPVAGCVEVADQCDFYEEYDIYWNIAVDHPTNNTKTINIIVINQLDRQNQVPNQVNNSVYRAEYSYTKSNF